MIIVSADQHVYGAGGANGLLPMPNKTTAKPERETWQDWWPEEPDPSKLLTREQLFEQLRQEGFIVSNEDLRNWQRVGAIPYGVRQWHDGATRALYPPAIATVIRTLRALQADGRKMTEIRESLRAIFRDKTAPLVFTVDRAEATGKALEPTLSIRKTGKGSGHIQSNGTAKAQVRREVPTELRDQIAAFTRVHEHAFGGRIVRAELRLIDEHGVPIVFRLDPHQPNE